MKPTVLNDVPQNIGHRIEDNSGGHGPFIGVYVNYNKNTRECTVTVTLEVGNRTYNHFSGTYLEVYDGNDYLYSINGNEICAGNQRIVIKHTHTYIANNHCSITARFAQAVGAAMANYERWNFSTTPIEFEVPKKLDNKEK